MRSADAYAELRRLGRPIVEIGEASTRLGLSQKRTTLHLRTLEEAGLTRRIRPGLWSLDPTVALFALPPYLTAPYPAYVSVWSALSHHGMIEQIPRVTTAVTTGRSRRIQTKVGTFQIHHVTPELFGGFTGSEVAGYIATPEKALFDTVYLRAPRGGRLRLPELELPTGFDSEKVFTWAKEIRQQRLRTIVERGIRTALSQAEEQATLTWTS